VDDRGLRLARRHGFDCVRSVEFDDVHRTIAGVGGEEAARGWVDREKVETSVSPGEVNGSFGREEVLCMGFAGGREGDER